MSTAKPEQKASAPQDPDPGFDAAGFALDLMLADSGEVLAERLVSALKSLRLVRDAMVLWSLSWPGERSSWPQQALPAERLKLAHQAFLAPEGRAESANGEGVALRLLQGPEGEGAILLFRPEPGALPIDSSPHWPLIWNASRERWSSWLESARLRDSVERLEQAERVQRALFAIADMAGSDLDMEEMLPKLHHIVGGLMYAENFYIALYDKGLDSIRFVYFKDTADPDLFDSRRWVSMREFERSRTWYLIRDGRSLMGPSHVLRRQVSGPLRLLGSDSADWMGVPMVNGSEVRGVLVVQHYTQEGCFSPADQALLSFVGSHILTALERKQGQEEMERRVTERTFALAEVNRELAQEVEER